jgi:hypothetical protein
MVIVVKPLSVLAFVGGLPGKDEEILVGQG